MPKTVDLTRVNIHGFIDELNNFDKVEEEPSYVGTIDKAVTVNIPVGLVAFIDSISDQFQKNGVSRSSVIRDLLRASVFDVLNEIDENVKNDIEKRAKQLLPSLVPDNMKTVAARFSVNELCDVVEV